MTTGDEQEDLPNILKSHSANRAVLRGHLALANDCFYRTAHHSEALRREPVGAALQPVAA